MRDLVFINYRTGEPTKNSSYDTHLHKLCDEAKIKRFCMHTLRHSCASILYANGVDILTIQKILGHAQLSTTLMYTHIINDQQHSALSQMGEQIMRNDDDENEK